MTQVYDNPQARIGALISGEFLKEMIERKFFPVEFVVVDGAILKDEEIDYSDIADDDQFVVAVNTNCNEVMFVQLFTEHRVMITTGLKAS